MNIAVVALIVVVVPFAIYGAGSLAWNAFVSGSDNQLDPPDCDEFRFDAAEWDDASGDAPAEQANGLAHCDLLLGMTRDEVGDMLGPADTSKRGFAAFALPESDGGGKRRLLIRLKEGEVTRAEYVDSTDFPEYD